MADVNDRVSQEAPAVHRPGNTPIVDEDAFLAPGRRSDITPADLQWKTWTWGVIRQGDCSCRDALLQIYSDGLAVFHAYTRTSDSGDVWLFKGIALLNVYGQELYRIGQFNGPRMELENYDYFIVRDGTTNPLYYPGQLFNAISGVTLYNHC